ncbi:MAG: hypothetical protein ACK40V_04295, partial [Anaerolineales bacterium]
MTNQTAAISTLDAEQISIQSVSLWRITWRRLFRRKSALVGMFILGVLIFIALTAELLAPYGFDEVLIGKENVTAREKPSIN